jgi:hypothetical protein
MPDSVLFLNYNGLVDYNTVNTLVDLLKNSPEYKSLDKTTGKRVYCILVECLENIAKHSNKSSFRDARFLPFISVWNENTKVRIKTGNPITQNQTMNLAGKLDYINPMDEVTLTSFYDEVINRDIKPGYNGAGLGFIMMKLKSGNRIDYSFTVIDNEYSFFEINILINKYIMRKLIFEKTASSPKVVLDPEKNIFEISGESRPANVGAFYGEILRWVDDYSLHLLKSQDITDPVVFNFDLEYFNSSSAKYILDFCKQVALVRSKGKNIEVKWKYEQDDIDMLEAGKEMSRISKLPFEFVKKDF